MIILDDRLKRIIQKARKHERKKTEIFYRTRFQKEVRILKKEHEKIISEKNKEVKKYQKQHERDIEAYELFKEQREFLNELYSGMEPNFKNIIFSIGKIFQKFKNQQDQIFFKTIETQKKDQKIKKLLHKTG